MSSETDYAVIAGLIDHSALHPTMTDTELESAAAIAVAYRTAALCIKPYAVPLAATRLKGTGVQVCSVVGFPHGSSATAIKVAETERACHAGASEIDVVVNVGKVLSGDWQYVQTELTEVNAAATANGAIVKVIFENDFLLREHIIRLCQLCSEVAVAFVKTSTGYGFVKQSDGGYGYRGATEEHLRLMLAHVRPGVQVKAAGGVRTLDDLLRVHALGVTRVGATATAAMLDAWRMRQNLPAIELKHQTVATVSGY